MKRFFLLTIALAAVAVSCTKSGLLESPQTYATPMTFEPYTGKVPTTKATVADDETVQTSGFQVVGLEEIENNEASLKVDPKPYMYRQVKYNSAATTENKWYYDIDAYWPNSTQEFTFLAYGLNAGVAAFDDKTTDYTTIRFDVADEVADQKDLVISPAIPNMCNEKISVKLHHVLSRIGFKVKAEGTGVNLIIKDIRLSGEFVTGGNFNLRTAVKASTSVEYDTPDTDAENITKKSVNYSVFDTEYEAGSTLNEGDSYPAFLMSSNDDIRHIYPNYNFGASLNLETVTAPAAPALDDNGNPEGAAAARYMMIMPQTVDATITIIYQLPGIEEVTLPITLNDQQFEAGKAYEFLFTVSTQAVKFGVTVDSWNYDVNGDDTVDDNDYQNIPLN